jgi:PAS domain S-box-containing protein
MACYVSAVGLVMFGQNEGLVRARNALATSQAQFRFIAEHAGDYVTVLDARGRIRYVSGAYQERFDPNLIRNGQHWTGLVLPADRERARSFLTSIMRSNRGARLSLNFSAANGSVVELECAANIIEEAGDAGTSMLVITSRRRTGLEQEMEGRFSRELMRHHAGYGLLVTSVMGRIELASPRMNEMLGYSRGELLGKTVDEIAEAIPSSDSLIDDVWRAVEIDGVCQRKFLAIDRNGRLKLAWANVVALRGDDEAPRFAWTIVDDPALTITQPEAKLEEKPEARKDEE